MTILQALDFLTDNSELEVKIRPEIGVTPAEPRIYWSVWITDSQVPNPDLGRCTTASSKESADKAIILAVNEWKQKYFKKKKPKMAVSRR